MAVKIGIIGAGAIGGVHLDAVKKAGFRTLAIADPDAGAVKRRAQEYDIPNAFNDPQKLLAMDDINAVIVAVPNKFHAPLSIAALNAGKDVLVEKPMGLNAGECRQMNEAAAKNKRVLQVGFVQRYSAVATTVKQFVGGGRLGHVYHAKANYYRRRGIPGLGGWFTTKAMSGGGPLIDLGVHVIDLVTYLMGSPKPVRVSGKVYSNFGRRMKDYLYESMWAGPPRLEGTFDVEDAAHALVRFEGGVTLEVNTTWAMNFPTGALPNVMGLFGDKGGATFQLGGSEVKIATEEEGHNVDIVPALRSVEPFVLQAKEFVRNCEERTQPHASGQAGQVVQSILDAIYESSEKDREVEL